MLLVWGPADQTRGMQRGMPACAGSWLDDLSDEDDAALFAPTAAVPDALHTEEDAQAAAGSRLSDASLAQLERLVEEQHRQVSLLPTDQHACR